MQLVTVVNAGITSQDQNKQSGPASLTPLSMGATFLNSMKVPILAWLDSPAMTAEIAGVYGCR